MATLLRIITEASDPKAVHVGFLFGPDEDHAKAMGTVFSVGMTRKDVAVRLRGLAGMIDKEGHIDQVYGPGEIPKDQGKED